MIDIKAEAEKISHGSYEHYVDCEKAVIDLCTRYADEAREEAAKKCEGLVTFTEDHGCNCEPCAWCEALEKAATAIRSSKGRER